MRSKFLTILVSFALAFALVPCAAFAEDAEGAGEPLSRDVSSEGSSDGSASEDEGSLEDAAGNPEDSGEGNGEGGSGGEDVPEDPVEPEGSLVKEEDGYRFLFSDGTYLKESWKDWEDETYYFDEEGYAVTGMNTIEKFVYLFDEEGRVLNAWQTYKGKKYYFSPKTNKALRYRQQIDGKVYYFTSDYALYTGWVTWKSDSSRSYFNPNKGGAAAKGWWTLGGKRYYFNAEGKTLKGGWTVSGKKYYFNANGSIRTGWLTWKDGRKSYYNPKNKGAAAKGWWTIGGKKYYFKPDTCKSVRYKQAIGGKTYYFNAKSQMRTGWMKWANGMHSYLGKNGVMRFGTHKINGRSYTFNSQGKTWAQRKLNVPCLMQYPQLPTGCESVALTNALNYRGFRLAKCTMADRWIPRSSYNFVTRFWGNPHSASGNSIAAPGLTMAANKFLNAKGSKYNAYNVSGKSLNQLYSYVANGHPVIVWSTIGQQSIGPCYGVQYYNGKRYAVYTNSHTLVLRGYDKINNKVYLADSISGYVTCSASWFAMTYSARGSQAVVIK